MKFTAFYTPGVPSFFHSISTMVNKGESEVNLPMDVLLLHVTRLCGGMTHLCGGICWYTYADTHVLIHICWYTCLLYVVPIETVEHNCTHFWMGYFLQKPLFLEDRKLRIPRNIHWIERVEISIERNIEYAKYRTLPPRMKAFLEMIVNHEKNDLIIIKFWLFSCIHNSVGRIWCKYFSGWIV